MNKETLERLIATQQEAARISELALPPESRRLPPPEPLRSMTGRWKPSKTKIVRFGSEEMTEEEAHARVREAQARAASDPRIREAKERLERADQLAHDQHKPGAPRPDIEADVISIDDWRQTK